MSNSSDLNQLIYEAKCKMAAKIAENLDTTIGLNSQDLVLYTAILEKLESRNGPSIKAIAVSEQEFKENMVKALSEILDDSDDDRYDNE